jgi:hypothetical protein
MKLNGTSCLYLCVYLSKLHLSQFLLSVRPFYLRKIKRTAKSLHKIRRTNKIRRILVLTADLHKIRQTNLVPWYIPWYIPSCQRAFSRHVLIVRVKWLACHIWHTYFCVHTGIKFGKWFWFGSDKLHTLQIPIRCVNAVQTSKINPNPIMS